MKYVIIFALVLAPSLTFATTLEITNIEITTSDNQVITSGDATGKMVPIIGGEVGRDVLHALIRRSNNSDLTDKERFIAQVLEQILLTRWQTIALNN